MPTLHALLLTDVVDSTRLTEALGDAAMAELWTTHDRVARDLLPPWRGREIDKTDGMLLLFDDVRDAVGYALAYHRALAARELPFKARAGIHVGPVSLRQNPPDDVARGAKPVEVDGLALPIAARVMSVALGAQTLLSADARLALGVAAQRVMSHGHWRMHGVGEPVELFEIGEAGEGGGAPFKAPPDGDKVYRVMRQGELWRPVREVRHSVPAERDSFVGRQEPLELLAKKFEDGARLVSVLGMGGTGKTRLVTRFAWTWLGDYPGGVWFCDLSQARTVDGIHFAVAQGLDVPLGKTDPVVQLAHAIAGRGRCLVILDNFEQVARFAEETLGHWLERAPLAQFLVTTREVLGIVGEETFALAPLPVEEAIQLFAKRSNSLRPNYRSGVEDDTAVAQLVRLLDGLPLAIELAAARVRVMRPETLLIRMSERFKLLSSFGGRQDRQATLRSTFDWSWDLLSATEKSALAQLSAFVGGFTLDAAEAVMEFSTSDLSCWAVDTVHSLVDKSFVRQVGGARLALLESVREYAAEHLRTPGQFAGSGPLAALAADKRHGAFFATMGPKRAVENSCVDIENLVEACKRAARRGDGDIAAKALDGAWGALALRGPLRVGIELSTLVLSIPGLSGTVRSLVDRIAGRALMATGRPEASRAHFLAAAESAQRAADRLGQLRALDCVAELSVHQGQITEGLKLYSEALGEAEALGDLSLQSNLLSGLGNCHNYLGDFREAGLRYEAALKAAQGAGDRRLEGIALGNLGQSHAHQGRIPEARHCYEQTIMIATSIGDRQRLGDANCNLGLLNHAEGRSALARDQLNVALSTAREMGYVRLECVVLCNLGIVEESLGEHRDARVTYEAAVKLARDLGDLRSEGQILGYLGALHARQGRLAVGTECVNAGATLLRRVSDQMSLGVLLCLLVEVHCLSGRFGSASETLKEARSLAVKLSAASTSELGVALQRATAQVDG